MIHLAYIDPGTGSFVVQAIVGTLAGVAFAIRGTLRRLVSLVHPGKKAREADGE